MSMYPVRAGAAKPANQSNSGNEGGINTGFVGTLGNWCQSLTSKESAAMATAAAIGISVTVWGIWNRRAKLISGVPLGCEEEWKPYFGHLSFIWDMIKNGNYQQRIASEHERCFHEGIQCFQLSTGLRGRLTFYPCTLEMVKEIFTERFDEFVKGPVVIELLHELLGEGIFNSNPPGSTTQRRSLEPMFSMRNLKNYMFECGSHSARIAMNKLDSLIEGDSSQLRVDMFDICGRFTLSSFLEISFGRTMLDIIGDYPEMHPFSISFDRVQKLSIASRFGNPLWKLSRLLGVGEFECQIAKDVQTLNEFASDLIDLSERAEAKNIFDESGIEKFDIISLYLKNVPNAEEKELRDVAMNMVIAGRDTTRVLLSWFLWCYDSGVMSEDHKSGLDDELSSVIQDGESAEDVTYTQLNEQLKFTEQCLLEVLRLYPPVKALLRSPLKDGTPLSFKNPDGSPNTVYLDRSVTISVSTLACHRSGAFFDDPLSFKPERWTKGVNTFPDHQFLSFNLMPRLCLGRHFALMEAKIFLVHFFHHFHFELESKERPVVPSGPLMAMKNGLPMRLSRREQK